MLKTILAQCKDKKVSDIHFTVGRKVVIRTSAGLEDLGDDILTEDMTMLLAKEILEINQEVDIQELKSREFLTKGEEKFLHLDLKGEVDLSFEIENCGRYRGNIYKQSGYIAIALRNINTSIPTIEELGLPDVLKVLAKKQRGLVLVTGPTGSGKSTTLASMIDYINNTRDEHIITIEDPVEYKHNHKKSIINQREIGRDTESFGNALRAALRQDPNIILVGEMRDLETISTAISAAETGHLVLSTLHTIGAAKTIDRIIDVFPPHQQQQVRTQLATVIEGVVSQQLMPKADGNGRVAGFEIMVNTPAIGNLIREGKTHQMQTVIQTGSQFGMKLMDSHLTELYSKGEITVDTLEKYAIDFNNLRSNMGMM